MLHFKRITLADKKAIQQITLSSKRRNCDLSFANLYSWNFLYQTEYAIASDVLFMRFRADDKWMYMLPVADRMTIEILNLLAEDAQCNKSPLVIAGVCEDIIPEIESLMPGYFTFTADRDYADYIYRTEDLLMLSGKKYQSKRNHINQFKNRYPDYKYCALAPEHISDCLNLEEKWCLTHDATHLRALQAERISMSRCLNHLADLDIHGGVLLVDNRIVAFTYGVPINDEVFDVCIEKADASFEGVYAMINHEFISHLPAQYRWINREEDLGIEGLRQSKLSYHPAFLVEKYIAQTK
ncbi:MAG: phosphatidylglycerol lysyltransferase domain-containing protein [Bacteroidales bacterium]